MITKDLNSKLLVNWREEPINKMNKPPRYIESDCYGEQDDTAKGQSQQTLYQRRENKQDSVLREDSFLHNPISFGMYNRDLSKEFNDK